MNPAQDRTFRPPAQKDRLIMHDIISRIEEALAHDGDPAPLILDAVHAAVDELGYSGLDEPAGQLRAIELEADRMTLFGVERLRSRLAYARAVLGLPSEPPPKRAA
jgi:hypothetical protein